MINLCDLLCSLQCIIKPRRESGNGGDGAVAVEPRHNGRGLNGRALQERPKRGEKQPVTQIMAGEEGGVGVSSQYGETQQTSSSAENDTKNVTRKKP